MTSLKPVSKWMHAMTNNPTQVEPVSWRDFNKDPPEEGERIVIVCDDGCSSSLAMMTETGPIDGEDAFELGPDFLRGALWFPLPVAYPLAFMERHDDY
jgi:hypothetical protein